MRNKRRFVNLPAVVLALGFVALFTYHSAAVRNLAPEPAVVVTVDLESLFNRLDEREHADRELQQLANRLQRDGQQFAESINELEEELELFEPGTDQHQKTLERLSLMTLEYQALVEFSQHRLEAEKSLTLKRLYQSIKQAASREADARGYDLVLVNDSLGELPPGDEIETIRQISARRMLYGNSRLDITDDLLRRMNREFHEQEG